MRRLESQQGPATFQRSFPTGNLGSHVSTHGHRLSPLDERTSNTMVIALPKNHVPDISSTRKLRWRFLHTVELSRLSVAHPELGTVGLPCCDSILHGDGDNFLNFVCCVSFIYSGSPGRGNRCHNASNFGDRVTNLAHSCRVLSKRRHRHTRSTAGLRWESQARRRAASS